MNLRINYFLAASRANGPGIRSVIWLQGCAFNCPGCCNPQTHSLIGGSLIAVDDMIEKVVTLSSTIEGITISGGEPFLQTEALYGLLSQIKQRSGLSVLVFSGYEKEVLEEIPQYRKCLDGIDALICGPYSLKSAPDYQRFCSSGNQVLWLLNDRYSEADFMNLTTNEVIIREDGEIVVSGLGRIEGIE
ncbi:MAG: 4Fe-4S single cluster domain-containing protein [Flexilinea sp.]